MGWKYEPPSPELEATNMLSSYHERLRAAERRDSLDVNLASEPVVPHASALRRLLGAVIRTFSRGSRSPQ
jgi:hypothetical protein